MSDKVEAKLGYVGPAYHSEVVGVLTERAEKAEARVAELEKLLADALKVTTADVAGHGAVALGVVEYARDVLAKVTPSVSTEQTSPGMTNQQGGPCAGSEARVSPTNSHVPARGAEETGIIPRPNEARPLVDVPPAVAELISAATAFREARNPVDRRDAANRVHKALDALPPTVSRTETALHKPTIEACAKYLESIGAPLGSTFGYAMQDAAASLRTLLTGGSE